MSEGDVQHQEAHTYLASWCNEGLELLLDVTVAEQENIVAILNGGSIIHRNPIQLLIIRAKANIDREYEIYYFSSYLNETDLRQLFHDDPQVIVDWIRKNGDVIHSDKRQHQHRVIA